MCPALTAFRLPPSVLANSFPSFDGELDALRRARLGEAVDGRELEGVAAGGQVCERDLGGVRQAGEGFGPPGVLLSGGRGYDVVGGS